MRQHFGVGFGSEIVTAFALELFAERRVIFDHAVVDEGEFAALVEMRMRIFVGHFSMGSPARVADAVGAPRAVSRSSISRAPRCVRRICASRFASPFTIATPAES